MAYQDRLGKLREKLRIAVFLTCSSASLRVSCLGQHRRSDFARRQNQMPSQACLGNSITHFSIQIERVATLGLLLLTRASSIASDFGDIVT